MRLVSLRTLSWFLFFVCPFPVFAGENTGTSERGTIYGDVFSINDPQDWCFVCEYTSYPNRGDISMLGGSDIIYFEHDHKPARVDGGADLDQIILNNPFGPATFTIAEPNRWAYLIQKNTGDIIAVSNIESISGHAPITIVGNSQNNHHLCKNGDRFDGGGGVDTADFFYYTSGVTVKLSRNGSFKSSICTLRRVESLVGSEADDTLVNLVEFGRLEGGRGNDLLKGNPNSSNGQRVEYKRAEVPVKVDISVNPGVGTAVKMQYRPLTGTDIIMNIRHITGSVHSGDVLIGNKMRNIIQGLKGGDSITGNDGADEFYYFSVLDSPANDADIIEDFSREEGDKINLRPLGKLKWIGAAHFTGRGQIRFERGKLFVRTKDGNMLIRLRGVTKFDPKIDLM